MACYTGSFTFYLCVHILELFSSSNMSCYDLCSRCIAELSSYNWNVVYAPCFTAAHKPSAWVKSNIKNFTHMPCSTWVHVLLLWFTCTNTATAQMQFQLPRVTNIWGTLRGQPNRNVVEKSQPGEAALRMTVTPIYGCFLNRSALTWSVRTAEDSQERWDRSRLELSEQLQGEVFLPLKMSNEDKYSS
jgi:hypothetical protein